MSAEYEFHSEALGWIPAETMASDNPEMPQELREGCVQLVAKLPRGGRLIYRQNVAHISHTCLVNILNGRCRLCGRREGDLALGRVYREAHAVPTSETRETEPAKALKPPETLEELKTAAPRTVRA